MAGSQEHAATQPSVSSLFPGFHLSGSLPPSFLPPAGVHVPFTFLPSVLFVQGQASSLRHSDLFRDLPFLIDGPREPSGLGLLDRHTDHRMWSPATPWKFGSVRGYYLRNLSNAAGHPNGRRAFLVDTLALVRRLESQGLTPKQAEAITAVITEVLNDSLENAAQTFASKADFDRAEMMAEATLSKFKTELMGLQEHSFQTLQREADRLRTDIDKMRSELRYEIDKVTAGQRLDLNLEKGRIRDELATQNQETGNLTSRLDREINNLKTQLEAAKYDVIKYCIGTLVSVAAVGLGLLRIMM